MVPDGWKRLGDSVAGERERCSEIPRQLGADVDLGLRDRMLEPQPVRVEKLPLEAEVDVSSELPWDLAAALALARD